MRYPFYYLVPQGIKLSTTGKCQDGQNKPVKVQVAAQGGLYLVLHRYPWVEDAHLCPKASWGSIGNAPKS